MAEKKSFFRKLLSARMRAAKRRIKRRLDREEFTIISDDCWAGYLCVEFGLKCHSPFVGMGITAREYIDFLCRVREEGALDIIGERTSEAGYPILKTRIGELCGVHYESAEEFRHAFERRRKLIRWDRILVKIDLGKPKYRPEDIARWNALKIPHSIAFYPDERKFREAGIHNGVALPDWTPDGAKQVGVSCRHLDVVDWINNGRVGRPASYRLWHLLFWERDFGGRAARFFRCNFGWMVPREQKAP